MAEVVHAIASGHENKWSTFPEPIYPGLGKKHQPLHPTCYWWQDGEDD